MYKYDRILIDDDALVRLSWKTAARYWGQNWLILETVGEFLALERDLDRKTPIYIDCELGEGFRGEEVSRIIFEDLGFREIYLATALCLERTHEMTWIRGVVGKEPLL